MSIPFHAQYVSKCGREDCPYCQGANGYDGKTWNGRACQYGMEHMAASGQSYRGILRLYYGDSVAFSDDGPVVVEPDPDPPPPDPPPPPPVEPPIGGSAMKLSDYPVPSGNTKFGLHLRPDQCQDQSGQTVEWHRAQLDAIKRWGGSWVNIISSPGGSDGWTAGKPGCSELTFEIAMSLGLGVIVRIFNNGRPPYWTDAVHSLLTRLVGIAGGAPFYVKFNNEIDAEWQSSAGRNMTPEDARDCCQSIAGAIDRTWETFNGKVIPSFLNVGYGGTGYNFFEIMHELGLGDRLDRCWVPVHPYNGAWEIDWPWNEILLRPILLTRQEYEAYGRAAWRMDSADRQTHEFVNAARERSHQARTLLTTEAELERSFAYGFFTYRWALNQLNALGHTETPLLFPEMGTRVGEMVEGLPCVGPRRHMDLTLQMIAAMQAEPRILGGCMWFQDARGAVQENWRDQGWYSPVWDKEQNLNLPADWGNEIATSGRLPIVDYLEAHPITVGAFPDPEEPGEEDPVPTPDPTVPVAAACDWQISNWNEARLVPATPAAGAEYWQCVRAALHENTMDHTLYVDAPAGVAIKVKNANGAVETLPEKTLPELRNRPIWSADCLECWVDDARPSDHVSGMHTRYHDVVGVNAGHVSYVLTFALRRAPSAPPVDPPVEPPVTPPTTDGCNLLLAAIAKLLGGSSK